ncbi:hypothetical protein ACP70R_009946 [Stipagrostis hirtigluma subsp. patula]
MHPWALRKIKAAQRFHVRFAALSPPRPRFPPFVLLVVFLTCLFPHDDPAYSVAVAAVAGLDPARDVAPASGRPTLSPVLNLTVHINNARDALETACLPILSTAVASYGDAFLGRGSVPEFSARPRLESETVARVWGQDVAVPRFLREQLAGELAVGEAAVDVLVTMPSNCPSSDCNDRMLVCRAKIGGGLSPCRLRYVPSRQLSSAGSATS